MPNSLSVDTSPGPWRIRWGSLYQANASFYDRWCLRAWFVAELQLFLSTFYAVGILLWPFLENRKYVRERFEGNVWLRGPNGEYIPYMPMPATHEAISTWMKFVVFAPILLAALNCPWRIWRFQQHEVMNVMVFASSQIILLAVCIWLTTLSFVQHKPLFRQLASVFGWLLPALIASCHGIRGLYVILSHRRQSIESHQLDPLSPGMVSDHADDEREGPLSQAYILQQSIETRPASDSEMNRSLDNCTAFEQEEIRHVNVSVDRPHPRPSNGPRLPWQITAHDLRFPTAFSSSLCTICMRMTQMTINETKVPPPNFKIMVIVVSGLPALAMTLVNALLVITYCRPRFVIVFTALCTSVIAIIAWSIMFIVMLGPLAEYRAYGMEFLAPAIALCHVWAIKDTLCLEWEPDRDSFRRMFARMRQRPVRLPEDL